MSRVESALVHTLSRNKGTMNSISDSMHTTTPLSKHRKQPGMLLSITVIVQHCASKTLPANCAFTGCGVCHLGERRGTLRKRRLQPGATTEEGVWWG